MEKKENVQTISRNKTFSKYKLWEKIGHGTYANVFKGSCHNNKHYAFKKMDLIKFGQTVQSELEILKQLKHPNIIRLLDNYRDDLEHVFVFHLYRDNLYNYLRKQLYVQHFETCSILIEICQGLDYLKKNKIIHRDLKPENILVGKNDELVIADFGMSIKKTNFNEMNKYKVQTVFYRSPEIFLKEKYDESIDMWSLGCIAYEIYFKKILFKFFKSDDLFVEQNRILGPPPTHYIKDHPAIYYFYDDINNPSYIKRDNQIYLFSRKNFIFNHSKNSGLIDFVIKCCDWIPSQRLTPQYAIKELKNLQKKTFF